ncbi:flagellar motor protein MotB [Roseicella aquatilis]|uniref:Chemotaxis protein MotB n=1 Tax=Roseicella aquatilis TaxID=2527868 RepID=A0A4R4DBH8_9PROT|nr:flagellar motor protein MotB [Roseicella aquatilis]TCZ57975.1 chemotaxis protein MotB [Roseicella aquatilis]
MARPGKNERAPVIVRRQEVVEAGHHGGAWKIAYADFVTAMMAFFLLMWLVNATTEAQKRGLADYFAPMNPLGKVTTGSGQPFGGKTLANEGRLVSEGTYATPMQRLDPSASLDETDDEAAAPPMRRIPAPRNDPARPVARPVADDLPNRPERAALAEAAERIRAAVRAEPALEALSRQLLIEEVPEGLRIQVVDGEGQPVFATGQAAPNERGRALLQRVAGVLASMAEQVEVTGHTDSTPFRGDSQRTNWELSAERANSIRRLLVDAGVVEARIRAVAGRADRDLLRPDQPFDPANRRVGILVHMKAASGRSP